MKIATRILIIFIIILGLLTALVIAMGQLADSRKQSDATTARLYLYHGLAHQLRQSSDDLTRMARTYVMTGDNIYKQYYNEIRAIRDGKRPRPERYQGSYWDLVIANKQKIPSRGISISLIDLMKNAGITVQELAVMERAKRNSDDLSKREKIAFAALKGHFPDDTGKLTIQGNPDPALAREILHNAQYHKAKAEILLPIREFLGLINKRIGIEIAQNKTEENLYRTITTLLVVTTILFSLLAFFYFRIKVVRPIVSLSNVAQRILSGDLNERAAVRGGDEIGHLNSAFNKMIEERIQIEFELKSNEQSLRTTLNSIGDALIATDIYGNIIRMNPVAEKLSGWLASEAEGKPLTEVFHIINATTRKTVRNPVNSVLGEGKVIGLANHTTLIAKDGTEHQIADSAAPIRDDDGDITGVVLVFRDVTEEYAIQEQLHKSEERFKRLFNHAEVSIWNEDLTEVQKTLNKLREDGVTDLRQHLEDNPQTVWDMTATVKVVQVNKATLKLFGTKPGDKFIQNIGKTFGPNTIKVFTDILCSIWNRENIFRSEADFQTLDGRTINTIISFQIPQTDGDFKTVPVSVMDVTQIKTAQAARKESEKRLSLHLEQSPLGVISWDTNMTCIQWNPAAEKIFGYTQEEALGKHGIELLVAKKLKSEMSQYAKQMMQQSGSTHKINENMTKDSRTIICEWFNTPLIDEEGMAIGITSMVQDITKHKVIEDELRKLSRAVEQSPAAILITDTEGTIEYVNPKFEESTGYNAKEVMGRTPRFLKSDDTSEAQYKTLWDTITAGKKWRGEFPTKRKDGSIFWEFASISPITAEDGTITHFLAIKEDITERKQLENHLRRSQKMEAIGELAGGIAHDFNNLLGIIIGNLDLMKRKVEEGSKLEKHLEKAQNAALRGSSLTRRLLNFSHQAPEIGRPANINNIIRSLEDLVGKSLTRKITLETVLADGLWTVALNSGDFEDMMINLSLNARDAMPKGGRLIIKTRNIVINHQITNYEGKLEPGDYVEITISDTGVGMAKEISAKIFDPFFTTKEKDKGTGLGLAMVYGFIQRTKGHISVHSEEGVGTTFKIFLPRSRDMTRRVKHPVTINEVIPGGTETILIVDDEKELTLIAKNILENLGYTAICAYNADEALQCLANNKIDLLFSDIIMTGSLNGFDFAETATRIYPELQILLTSGFTGNMQTTEETGKWEEKIIVKPYRNVDLANRIRQTLDKKG
ncbi:MAG: hypothetical protein COB49_02555 [Alphaproteobacteria bacterium]|nr:MAG: hypothetical protein COB49_02555 [Alphaproteobacteria bacterium]